MLILIGYQNIRTMPRSLIQKIIVEIFKGSLSSLFFCLLSIFIVFFFFFWFLFLILFFSLFVLILAVTEILNSYVN